jgi:catechol 2,3-dioxygenase-like lactoylglutathione lyase family enzyme
MNSLRLRSIVFPLPLLLSTIALAQLPPGNEKGVSMGHLHFRVTDPAVHKKLLVEALGAKVLHAGPLEIYQLPGVHILLTRGTPSGGNAGTVIDHLGFKVQDLDAVKAKLTAAGAKVLSENPGTRQMFILFPDAIKIEFTEDKTLDKPVVHDHIHFAVPQIEEQRAWYEKTFGAKLGMTGRFKAADIPGVNLRWNPAVRRLPGIKGTSVDHIGFEVANLEAFCKKLEAEGIKFDVPYRSVESMGLSIAFLTDPWGVYIELTEGLAALDKKAQAKAP